MRELRNSNSEIISREELQPLGTLQKPPFPAKTDTVWRHLYTVWSRATFSCLTWFTRLSAVPSVSKVKNKSETGAHISVAKTAKSALLPLLFGLFLPLHPFNDFHPSLKPRIGQNTMLFPDEDAPHLKKWIVKRIENTLVAFACFCLSSA